MDKLIPTRDMPSQVADASSDVGGAVRRLHRRNRKSLFAEVLRRPLSLAVLYTFGSAGLVAIGFAAAWIVPGLLDSAGQRSLHLASVHADHSTLKTQVVRAFAAAKTLVYRDRDGGLHRALVDQTDFDRFANETFEYLETERATVFGGTGDFVVAGLIAKTVGPAVDRTLVRIFSGDRGPRRGRYAV
jgi:hypothetical protein